MWTALTSDRGLEQRVLGLQKLSEREGFMQTDCYDQSGDKASQGYTASTGAQAGSPSSA
jgi:hypothetical protein